jgi:hypothetical protein
MKRFLVVTLLSTFLSEGACADGPRVALLKTPDAGIQPQALVDAKGVLHLIYYKGDPGAGDLFYVKRLPGKAEFSPPIRINSQPGSAIAAGTIRGGQLALGKDGRVHVVWNGSNKAEPKNPAKGTPMLYARLNDTGTAFEPQRNLMQASDVLDGGGTVAADSSGNVYVAWHGQKIGERSGERGRKVWLARSSDDGKTFTTEATINPDPTGVCACCSMRGFIDSKGAVHFLYRAAKDGVDRDMFLLSSSEPSKKFQSKLVHPWNLSACPMSSMSFAEGKDFAVAAWETEGQVYVARFKPGTAGLSEPIAAPGTAKGRKHPTVAINAKGEMLFVWTEGTGWKKGGALAWQVYHKSGRPTDERGRVANAIPVWGLASAVTLADGSFLILH